MFVFVHLCFRVWFSVSRACVPVCVRACVCVCVACVRACVYLSEKDKQTNIHIYMIKKISGLYGERK